MRSVWFVLWNGIFLFLGLGLLILVVQMAREERQIADEGIAVRGVVREQHIHEGRGARYIVTVAFTPRGTERTLVQEVSVDEATYTSHHVGDSIGVRYLAGHPEGARVEGSGSAWPGLALLVPWLILCGIVCLRAAGGRNERLARRESNRVSDESIRYFSRQR